MHNKNKLLPGTWIGKKIHPKTRVIYESLYLAKSLNHVDVIIAQRRKKIKGIKLLRTVNEAVCNG